MKRGLAPPKKLVPFCLLDAELLHHRLYFKPFLKAQRRTSPPLLGVRKDAIHVHKHVKREKVLIQWRYRLLLVDHEIDSRGNNDNFRIPQRQTPRLCSLNQYKNAVCELRAKYARGGFDNRFYAALNSLQVQLQVQCYKR